MTSPRPLQPIRCLRHPLWLAALALLVVNDHLLKGSAAPAWLTGKLSDFAGPIVAAALLAVLCRARSGRGWALSHAAVALGFAAINLSPAVARWVEHVTAATPVPWVITVDPTDLVGLIALPFSLLVLGRVAARPDQPAAVAWRGFAQWALVAVAALACTATSSPCEDGDCTGPDPGVPPLFGAVALGNATGGDRLVRIRTLKPSVAVDCDSVLADPSRALGRQLFAPAETWLLTANRTIALNHQGDACTAYLIEAEGMSPTVLAWGADQFPEDLIPGIADESSDRVAAIEPTNEGTLALRHAAAFRLRRPAPPPTRCEIPPATVGVAWSDPPRGGEIADIATSPDGCNAVSFQGAGDFVLCMPGDFPFSTGEMISLREVALDGAAGRGSLVLEATGAEVALEVGRGSVFPTGVTGLTADETCPLQHDECGSSVRVARAVVDGADGAATGAGSSVSMSGGAELRIVRAQHMPARDLECLDGIRADYFEYALITPLAQ